MLPFPAASRQSAMPLHAPSPSPSPSRRSGFPGWALLDTVAHMGSCRGNATTAFAETSTGCPIEVSFEVDDPPALTRCVVHCSDLKAGDFVNAPPCITGADGAFVLIRVILRRPSNGTTFTDVFLYRAGPGVPSLKRLPPPYPFDLTSDHVGVLHCGEVSSGHCLVVVPQLLSHTGRFDVFSSEDTSNPWSIKVATCGTMMYRGRFKPKKVFSLEGGSLAWVDLRSGILLCNSVAEDPVVHLIQLPPLMPINRVEFGMDFDGMLPPLDSIRDVTCTNGWFRLIEMGFQLFDDGSTAPSNFRWMASMFKRKIGSDNWESEPCYTVNSANLFSAADSISPTLFPKVWDYKENKLTLNNVISIFPTLDLYNDDVFYMLTKLKGTDTNGWVLAVNGKSKTLEKSMPFATQRLSSLRTFMQCAFSKHLGKDPGSHLTKDVDKCTNWEKALLLCESRRLALDMLRNIGSFPANELNDTLKEDLPMLVYAVSILLVQDMFGEFETYVQCGKPSCDETWSLLEGYIASSLDPHIDRVLRYASGIGRGKAVLNAVSKFRRALREIGKALCCWSGEPSARDKHMRDSICFALRALDELTNIIPSSVLDTARRVASVCKSINPRNIAEEFALHPPGSKCVPFSQVFDSAQKMLPLDELRFEVLGKKSNPP